MLPASRGVTPLPTGHVASMLHPVMRWLQQLGAAAVLLVMCLLSLGRWGHPEAMEFEFAEYTENPLVAAVASYNSAPKCWIAVNTDTTAPGYFWGLEPEIQQRAMDHEVGHCLGLSHPAEGDERPQVMRGLDSEITAVDVAEYRKRWRPYQATVGMVAGD